MIIKVNEVINKNYRATESRVILALGLHLFPTVFCRSVVQAFEGEGGGASSTLAIASSPGL